MTGTPWQRVRAGVVDTRVTGKQDQFDGDPMMHADWSWNIVYTRDSSGQKKNLGNVRRSLEIVKR